jgi:hypothetical protein
MMSPLRPAVEEWRLSWQGEVGLALEAAEDAVETDVLHGANPGSLTEPSAGGAQGNRLAGDGRPGTGLVQGEHADPRALDPSVEASEVGWIEAFGGDKVG